MYILYSMYSVLIAILVEHMQKEREWSFFPPTLHFHLPWWIHELCACDIFSIIHIVTFSAEHLNYSLHVSCWQLKTNSNAPKWAYLNSICKSYKGLNFLMIDEPQSQQELHATSSKLQDVFEEWYDFKYLNILHSFEKKDCYTIHTIEILI